MKEVQLLPVDKGVIILLDDQSEFVTPIPIGAIVKKDGNTFIGVSTEKVTKLKDKVVIDFNATVKGDKCIITFKTIKSLKIQEHNFEVELIPVKTPEVLLQLLQ